MISLLFFATAFANTSRLSASIVAALSLGVLILSFRTLGLSHKIFQRCVHLAGIAYVLDSAAVHVFQDVLLLRTIANIVYVGLLAMSIVVLSRHIFREQRVTGDTLRGSTCIYLLLGYFWFVVYHAIQQLDPNAFQVTVERSGNVLLYFSFVTLTTMGYGDIIPTHPLTMTCANIEGVIGVLYPAVFIARLVSVYTTQTIDQDQPK